MSPQVVAWSEMNKLARPSKPPVGESKPLWVSKTSKFAVACSASSVLIDTKFVDRTRRVRAESFQVSLAADVVARVQVAVRGFELGVDEVVRDAAREIDDVTMTPTTIFTLGGSDRGTSGEMLVSPQIKHKPHDAPQSPKPQNNKSQQKNNVEGTHKHGKSLFDHPMRRHRKKLLDAPREDSAILVGELLGVLSSWVELGVADHDPSAEAECLWLVLVRCGDKSVDVFKGSVMAAELYADDVHSLVLLDLLTVVDFRKLPWLSRDRGQEQQNRWGRRTAATYNHRYLCILSVHLVIPLKAARLGGTTSVTFFRLFACLSSSSNSRRLCDDDYLLMLYRDVFICSTSIQPPSFQVLSSRLSRTFRDVVRVAPNEIVFATTQAALDIYNPAVKHHETWLKTDVMDFGSGDGGFIWEQDPVKRREVAKKILPAFSTKAIKAKEPTVQQYIDLFVTKMKAIGSEQGGVDLNTWLVWLAMDMSADLAYSRELHQMRDETSSDFMETLLGTNLFGTIMQVSKKLPLLTPLAYLVVPLKVIRKVGKTFRMNSEEVQRRINNHGNTKHPDFMDYMLPVGTPVPVPKKLKVHIEQVALQMFIAGFDPIQLVFFSSLFFLLKEPEVHEILVQEIRSNFNSYDEITPDALSALPYLNACIHETLRVHTTNSTGMPRRSPGAMVDGYYIPKGTSFFTIARSPRNFHEPLNFRPTRWLHADHPKYDARFAEDKLKSYFPFSLGPRACTGREIAWSQSRLFLAKVLWTFDLQQTRGQDATFDQDYRIPNRHLEEACDKMCDH
ncbi:hypothetical protein CHU98_g225 [Xylaria longipes]|nr:hypothetical protein CHU98_g225 [Xylaria longipes]